MARMDAYPIHFQSVDACALMEMTSIGTGIVRSARNVGGYAGRCSQDYTAFLITPYGSRTCSASLGDLCSSDADCGGTPGSCQASVVENCANFINPTRDNSHAFVSNTLAPIASC